MAFGYLYLSFINTSDKDSCTELTYAGCKNKSDTCFILLKYYFGATGGSIYSQKLCRTFWKFSSFMKWLA